MADTVTSSLPVSDLQAHPDEPAQKKVDEEMQTTKQEDLTPSGDVEKPELARNVCPEALHTKLGELQNNEQPEPPARTDPEAESTGQEIPQVEKKCFSESQELIDEVTESKMEETAVAVDVTKESGEKLATEAVQKETEEKIPAQEVAKEHMEISADATIEKVAEIRSVDTIENVPDVKPVSEGVKIVPEENSTPEGVQSAQDEESTIDSIAQDETIESESIEKPSIEPVESIRDNVATEAVEKVKKEETPIQEAVKEQMEILVNATLTKEPENTSALEVIERIPQDFEEVKNVVEDTPAAGECKIVTEEKPTAEAAHRVNDEKATNEEASGSIVKPTTEGVSSVMEKVTESAPAEKPTIEAIESILDEPAAVEKAEHKAEEKPSIEELDKPKSEKVVEKTNVPPFVTVELKEPRIPEESKDNMVSNQEKFKASLEPILVETTLATSEEAQLDQKAEEKPAVSEGDKASSEVTTKEAVRAKVTQQSLEDEVKLPEKVEETKEKSEQIEDDKEKKAFRLGDLMQEDTTETENAGSFKTTPEFPEKSSESEQTSRDIEVNKEKATEAVEEKNAQPEVETEEKVEVDAIKAKTEKKPKELMESDNNAPQESKDLSTEQVSAKPAYKQSSNILSKMKKSIVKVKKALIGKSPSSRNISTEA